MIVSLAELLILGLIVDWAFRKLTVPGLVGMLFLGVLFGPMRLAWSIRNCWRRPVIFA